LLNAAVVGHHTTDAAKNKHRHRGNDCHLELFLSLILLQGGQALLVLLCLGQLLHAGLVLHLSLGFFDFTLGRRFDSRLFFAPAEFFDSTSLLCLSKTTFFLSAFGCSFCLKARAFGRLQLSTRLSLVGDAVLFEAHQLVEREKNGTFVFVCHGIFEAAFLFWR